VIEKIKRFEKKGAGIEKKGDEGEFGKSKDFDKSSFAKDRPFSLYPL
jgi:hypothetical protein